MKVLIVGGGVAGSTLAAFLQRNKRFKITLIDQAPQFGNIGFAIALWGNGRYILKELGLDHTLVDKNGYEIRWDVAENIEGKVLKTFYLDIFKNFGPTVILSRSDLHSGLTSLLTRVDIRFGTTISKIKNYKNFAEVIFNNGQKEKFDLVVGADGIRSKIREMVFGKHYLSYAGWRVWAAWIPPRFSHPSGAVDVVGNGKIYVVYPMLDRAVVMFGAVMPPKSQTMNTSPHEDLQREFAGFKESVQKMIKSLTDPKMFNDDINYVEMDRWYKNRVVLIGDAQHGLSPVTGMGASLAMEDAFVLEKELMKVRNSELPQALEKFALRREPRIRKISKASRRLDAWCLAAGTEGFLRDIFLPLMPTGFFLNRIRDLLKEPI